MHIELQPENSTLTTQSYVVRIDGRLFGFAIQNASDKMPAGKYQLVILNDQPAIIGQCNFSDEGIESGSMVLGDMVGDDFILGSRPAYARFYKAVVEAIDNLEKVVVEVV